MDILRQIPVIYGYIKFIIRIFYATYGYFADILRIIRAVCGNHRMFIADWSAL